MITIFIHGNIISTYTLAFKILSVIPKVSDLNFVKEILTLHVSSFLDSTKKFRLILKYKAPKLKRNIVKRLQWIIR